MIRRLLAAVAALLVASPALAQIDPSARGMAASALTREVWGTNLGMVGDGVTDNSTALARVLAAVGPNGGTVNLPCGKFNFSTPLVVTSQVIFQGAGTNCTKLYFTPNTGAAVTYQLASGFGPGFGLRDLLLQGTSASNATIGLLLGTSSGSGHFYKCSSAEISGFGVGFQYGSNTWNTDSYGCMYLNNGKQFLYPATLTNAGENVHFNGDTFGSTSAPISAACVDIEGFADNIKFDEDRFDNCPVTVNASNTHVVFDGTHLENPAGALTYPLLTVTQGNVTLDKVNIYLGPTPTIAPIELDGGAAISTGLWVYNNGGSILPTVFNVTGSASLQESLTHPIIGTNGAQNLVVNAGTGKVIRRTPPNLVNVVASIYEDPEGATNFGSKSQVSNPRSNPGPINLVTQSNNFGNGAWSIYTNAPTLTANTTDVKDPFGGNNAWKVVASAAGTSGLFQTASIARVAGQPYTSELWFYDPSGSLGLHMGPDDTACTVTAPGLIWKQVSCTQTAATNLNESRIFEFFAAANSVFYIYGAATCPGSSPCPYVPTTSSPYLPPQLTTSGAVQAGNGVVQLRGSGYTVSTLPPCGAQSKGELTFVTDATSPTYGGALTGGGAVIAPVFCDGTAWTSH